MLYKTTPDRLYKVISTSLESMGVSKVYDLSLSQQLVLGESYREFKDKFQQTEKYQKVVQFLEKVKGLGDEEIAQLAAEFKKSDAKLPSSPVLCSECPGWVCYAEKVQGDVAIPYMSLIKSPQQIQGYLLKKVSNKSLFTHESNSETLPKSVVHVCIMP